MLPRFSVKKSITVYVAVVIIIVLGIVSYTKMTPDLLPNMDLPYIMIMTTYPGATPEEVETTVTKPLEQWNYATRIPIEIQGFFLKHGSDCYSERSDTYFWWNSPS